MPISFSSDIRFSKVERLGRKRKYLLKDIIIAEYDQHWPIQFRREAERIQTALGDRALEVEHIGSTSVPSLAAKLS
jgi:GrpB-like predicted nucleotidyltransferase (UPF0157 family)